MLWSLVIVPCAGALLAGAMGGGRLRAGAVAAVTLALTLALAALAAAGGWTGGLWWSEALRLSAALTPLSAAVAVLVPAVALPVAVYAVGHEERDGLARLLALMLLFVGGMQLLVVADDLLTLLIGWEVVGACSWALIGHRLGDLRATSAGLYAFVATRTGDLGLVLAVLAAFAGGGGFAFDAIAALPSPHLEIVAFGVLVAAAAKSGQLPFSPWLFRAMSGPSSVSALLHAATMVAAGAYIVARLGPALSAADGFAAAAIGIGLATALAGGVVAVLQNHAKRLLAASTSAQFGLIFAAAGAGYPAVAILHLVAHACLKAPLFMAAGIAGERAGSFALDRMALGRALPLTAVLSLVAALALAGVPPLGAAWTKEAIVAAAGHAGHWAAAAVMLAGGLGAAYAARFQFMAFRPAEDPPDGRSPGLAERAGLAALAILSLSLGVLWLPAGEAAAGALLGAALPASGLRETVLSLLLVGLGLLAGLSLARSMPGLGEQGAGAAASDWLGLPTLIHVAVADPFARLAGAAARFDDGVLDALPRGAALMAQGLAARVGRADGRAVDRGVDLVAALTAWAARIGDRLGERIADGLPGGTGWLAGQSGRDLRLLQTGLSHHYYALVALGAAGMIVLLLIGS